VLPIVAVQVSPAPPAPALEERLLSACSAGLAKARCVAARELSPSTESELRAIAMVFFVEPARVSIEVGLSGESDAAWVSRELEFAERDPDIERWRAIGFTIALLADDRRFWAEPVAAATVADAPPEVASARPAESPRSEVDGRALAGTGVVGGALRLGAELRVAARLASAFFATGSVSYTLAEERAYDVRWFDGSLGLGYDLGDVWREVGARLRLEAVAENVAVSAERGPLADRRSAWIPGVCLGADLSWRFAAPLLLSAGLDAFWLDGGTAIRAEGERLGTSAGAGFRLGLGAGYGF
jgi:hypothetical protein